MPAILCAGCRSLSLEFFLGEDISTAENSDSDDSFEVTTSSAYNTSFRRLETATLAGCELCGIISRRLKQGRGISLPAPNEDPKVQVVKTFDRYHRLAIHYRESILYLPVYVNTDIDKLVSCDENYTEPPHETHPLASPPTMHLAASWLTECDKRHACTKKSPSMHMSFPKSMPMRVIDVGTIRHQSVRLVSLTDLDKQGLSRRYTTLSHCWGTGADISLASTTTKAALAARRQIIEISDLQKTFQDAIHVTRALGIRFLWIDSLCIVQDDPEDVDLGCQDMSEIYSYSYCTIAASDSVSGQGGCFTPFNASNNTSCSFQCRSTYSSLSAGITIYQGYDEWISTLNGPLQKRGWVLQERDLSPRILHFTNSRLLFECQECHSSADRPHMEVKLRGSRDQGALRLMRIRDGTRRSHGIMGGKSLDPVKWVRIVEEYSQRSLSFSSDKLPALSGLATWFYPPGTQYAAGMSASSFKKDLYWRPGFRVNEQTRDRLTLTEYTIPGRGPRVGVERHRSRIQGLPTWSWASMNSAIVYLGYDASIPVTSLQVLDYDIALAGANPYGAIKHAKVRITGLAVEAYAVQIHGFNSYNEWYQSSISLATTQYSQVDATSPHQEFSIVVGETAEANTFRASFYIDATDEEIPQDCPLLCLLTCNMERYYEPEDPDIAGLAPRDAGNEEWKRVGTFQTRGAERQWFRSLRELILI